MLFVLLIILKERISSRLVKRDRNRWTSRIEEEFYFLAAFKARSALRLPFWTCLWLRKNLGHTPFLLRYRCLLGPLIPFLWALKDWLRAVWFFCFTIFLRKFDWFGYSCELVRSELVSIWFVRRRAIIFSSNSKALRFKFCDEESCRIISSSYWWWSYSNISKNQKYGKMRRGKRMRRTCECVVRR